MDGNKHNFDTAMDTNTHTHSKRCSNKDEHQEYSNKKDQGEKGTDIEVNKNGSVGVVGSQHQTTNNEAVSIDGNVVMGAVDDSLGKEKLNGNSKECRFGFTNATDYGGTNETVAASRADNDNLEAMASTMFHQLPSMETENYDWSGANNNIRLSLVEYLIQYSSYG